MSSPTFRDLSQQMNLESCRKILQELHKIYFDGASCKEVDLIFEDIRTSPMKAYLNGIRFTQGEVGKKGINVADFQTGALFGVCIAAVSGDPAWSKVVLDAFEYARASSAG